MRVHGRHALRDAREVDGGVAIPQCADQEAQLADPIGLVERPQVRLEAAIELEPHVPRALGVRLDSL